MSSFLPYGLPRRHTTSSIETVASFSDGDDEAYPGQNTPIVLSPTLAPANQQDTSSPPNTRHSLPSSTPRPVHPHTVLAHSPLRSNIEDIVIDVDPLPNTQTSDTMASTGRQMHNTPMAAPVQPQPDHEVAALKGRRGHGDEALNMIRTFTSYGPHLTGEGHGSVLAHLLELQRLRHRHVRQRARQERAQGGVNPVTLNTLLLQTIASGSVATSRRASFEELQPPTGLRKWNEQTDSVSSVYTRASISGYVSPTPDSIPLPEQLRIASEIAQVLLKQDYLMMLCEAMVNFGAPSHRITHQMGRAAKKLDLDAVFFTQPGVVIIRFGDPVTRTSETHILRVNNGYNMDKLSRAVRISRNVERGEKTLDDAVDELDELLQEPNRFKWWTELFAFFLSSFAASPLIYNGSWIDAAVAGCVGIVVGSMSILARYRRAYSDLFEVSSSVVASFLAVALRDYVCVWSVMLGSVIMSLPGLTLTLAVMELISRNIVSGAVRMFYALIVAMLIGYGLVLGVDLWHVFDSETEKGLNSHCDSISPWWYIMLLPLIAISFNIHLQAAPRQWWIMALTASLGYVCSYFTGIYVKTLMAAPTVGAFVIGIIGNLYAGWTGEPAVVPVLPAILLQVPGGLGVRGTVAFLQESQGDGLVFAVNMVLIAMGLTVGLFAAALFSLIVLPHRVRRRSALMSY